MRQQSRRPGPVGDAAGLAVLVVNRSASLLSEVSAEVARATARESGGATAATTRKRRSPRRKERPKAGEEKRAKPAG